MLIVLNEMGGVLREILWHNQISRLYFPCSENTLRVPSINPRKTFSNQERTASFVWNLQRWIDYCNFSTVASFEILNDDNGAYYGIGSDQQLVTAARNILVGVYEPGKTLSITTREEIVNLWIVFACPHVIVFVWKCNNNLFVFLAFMPGVHTRTRRRFSFFKFPFWTAFLKSCLFGDRFHQIRVDGRPNRKEKVAFSNENGYVYMGLRRELQRREKQNVKSHRVFFLNFRKALLMQ